MQSNLLSLFKPQGLPRLLMKIAFTRMSLPQRPAAEPDTARGFFEDTAILSLPERCRIAARRPGTGPPPIYANYLEVGSRGLLGVGAGHLALLAFMPSASPAPRWISCRAVAVAQRCLRIDRGLLQAESKNPGLVGTPCCYKWLWSAR